MASPNHLMGTLMGTLMGGSWGVDLELSWGVDLELDWRAFRRSIFASNWTPKLGREMEAQMLLLRVLFFDMLREVGF